MAAHAGHMAAKPIPVKIHKGQPEQQPETVLSMEEEKDREAPGKRWNCME